MAKNDSLKIMMVRLEERMIVIDERTKKIESKINGTDFNKVDEIIGKFGVNESLTKENRRILWVIGSSFLSIVLIFIFTKLV